MKFHLAAFLVVTSMALSAQSQAGKATADPAAMRPFTLSKETTLVTGPVRPDGTIDYVAALNERASKGVTPENNGAIPFLKAIGNERPLDAACFDKVRALLKMQKPAEADAFVSLRQFVLRDADAAKGNADVDAASARYDELLSSAGWKSEQAPVIANWLKANERSLNLMVEASARERFYVPAVCDTEPAMFMQAKYPYLNAIRDMATALKVRALLRLGSGDFDGFRKDTLAVLRFARLASQSPVLVGKLVAIGCEALGNSIINVSAAGGNLTAEQCDRLFADLGELPPAGPDVGDCFEFSERFMMLDVMVNFAVYGPVQGARIIKGDRANIKPMETPGKDWDAALRKCNGWFDRLAAVGKEPTHALRMKASAQIEKDAEELHKKTSGMFSAFAPIEDNLISILIPTSGRAFQTQTRIAMDRELTQIALAMRAYQARNGKYPASLAELSPKYLKTIPTDRFTEKPLVYRLEGAGYVIYSLGPNGRDDGGVDTNKGDDVVIRAEK